MKVNGTLNNKEQLCD